MKSSILSLLPIGLLLFMLTYWKARHRESEWERASKGLVALAGEWGLSHQAPTQTKSIGVITGERQGFALRVDPDEGARILVRFKSNPGVEFRTFKFLKRVPAGMEEVFTESTAFDSFFVERYATSEVADRVFDAERLEPVTKMLLSSPQAIDSVAITSLGVECRLKTERASFITREAAEVVIPALIELASLVENETRPELS